MTNYITKQYMKYMVASSVVSEVNNELEKGARVILMVPFLQTDHCGSHTSGYNVLFEKEKERDKQKSETITEFADRCRECGAKYGKLLKEAESKSNASELKPCPFCGTEVKMRKIPLYGYSGCFEFDVRCSKCGCTLDFTQADSIYRSEQEAVANVTKKWNERKETK